jgi:glycine/D-amino acid oxidase-like deaminating enzyme
LKPQFCISAGLCFILSAGSLLSQITGGSIVGSVTDPGGAVVANAAVEATNVETNAVTKTVTNGVGSYAFPLLPVGEYVLTVEAPGFQRAITGKIRLHAGTKPRIDITMVLGQVSQSVEVIAEAPLVNATTTELGVVIDSKKMRDMPLNGRDFKQLMSLQPGWNTGGFAANASELDSAPSRQPARSSCNWQ